MAGSEYVNNLEKALHSRNDISQWRFTLGVSTNLEVGMELNLIGGPYRPPTVNEGMSSNLYIVWNDKNTSNINLEPHHFEDLPSVLDELKDYSRNDPDAAPVIEPSTYKKVKVFDNKVADMIDDSSYLFELLEMYQSKLGNLGTQNIEAGASSIITNNYLRSSTGMNEHYESTSMSTLCTLDGQFGDSDSSRRKIFMTKAKKLVSRAINEYKIDQKKIDMPSGKTEVIFAPSIAPSMIRHFIGTHLNGMYVAENKSNYTPENFNKSKPVFPSEISIILDGISDYETTSSPYDGEGVPNSYTELIKDGRLISPLLDVKWATKLGMNPTGSGSIYLEVPNAITMKEMISGTRDGVIIYGALGLSQQPYEAGDYSLPAFMTHRVLDGKIIGSGKVSISGNIFKDLKDKNIQFVYDPFDPKEIGFKLTRSVYPLKD